MGVDGVDASLIVHGGLVHVPTGEGWAASYPEQCVADRHA